MLGDDEPTTKDYPTEDVLRMASFARNIGVPFLRVQVRMLEADKAILLGSINLIVSIKKYIRRDMLSSNTQITQIVKPRQHNFSTSHPSFVSSHVTG